MWEFRAVALSELGLTGAEYGRATPAELGEMFHGVKQRERRDMRRTAWAVAHLMNISGKSLKRDVRIEELLGEEAEAEWRRELDAQWRADQEAERAARGEA